MADRTASADAPPPSPSEPPPLTGPPRDADDEETPPQALSQALGEPADPERRTNVYDWGPEREAELAAELAARKAARTARLLEFFAFEAARTGPQRNALLVCTWPRCLMGGLPRHFKRCGACRAPYCTRSCQCEDWPRHRPECRALVASRREREYGAGALVLYVAPPAAAGEAAAAVDEAAARPEAVVEATEPTSATSATASSASVFEPEVQVEVKAKAAVSEVTLIASAASSGTAAVAAATEDPAIPDAETAATDEVTSGSPSIASVVAHCLFPANIRAEAASVEQRYAGPLEGNLSAAERGEAAAQVAMGDRYKNGHAVTSDVAKAARWWRKAADQSFATAQFHLAQAYATGEGLPQSDSEAIAWLRLSSAQGEPNAQELLGKSYESGSLGLSADIDEAVRLYVLVAASGVSDAVANLRRLGFSPSGTLICLCCGAPPQSGAELRPCNMCKEAFYCDLRCLVRARAQHEVACVAAKARGAAQKAAMDRLDAEVQKWRERPLTELRRAASEGAAAAQTALGNAFKFGEKGLAKSPQQAAEWRAKAASAGNARAQTSLGWQYDNGDGVAQDKVAAVRLYRLAALQGLPLAQFNLAKMLSEGEGCERAPVQALRWMRRAAELGDDADAQSELARWYMLGECGLIVSFKDALRQARLSAAQGSAAGLFNLGILFHNGWGVVKDLDEASKCYYRAAVLGLEAAKANLRVLDSEGHAPSIAAVRALRLGLP